MIRQSLMLLALSILVSSSVFATVTSHKEWGASEIKLTLNQSNKNNSLYNAYMIKAKANKQASQWLQATSKINKIQFFEDGNTVTATADTSHFLANLTSEYQAYTVTQSACTMKKEGNVFKEDRCSNSSSTYVVNPSNTEFSSTEASMHWADVKPGDYLISFGTSIQNSEGDILFSTYDFATLMVPAKS